MNIKKLELHNFRAFEDISIDFNEGTSAIIGNNGAGKTSMLDAIAICMTHFTGNLISDLKSYNIDAWFTDSDITNGMNQGVSIITVNDEQLNEGKDITIKVTKIKKDVGLNYKLNPKNVLNTFKAQLKKDHLTALPIIAYFNVNRTSEPEALESKGIKGKPFKTYNKLLYAYERALELRAPSFKYFEKWFSNHVIEENALKVRTKQLDAELPSLKLIRDSLNQFFSILEPDTYGELFTVNETDVHPDFSEDFNTALAIKKNGNDIFLNQLSHGERMVLGLVAETARRLFIANKSEPQSGRGILLIDEIEMHLHPEWQKNIARALEKTFPNLNIIFTTHSPLILSGLRRECIKVIDNYKEIPSEELPDIYSATADEVLERIMHISSELDEFEKERQEIDRLFNEHEFEEANQKLEELKEKVDSHPQWLIDYEQKISFVLS